MAKCKSVRDFTATVAELLVDPGFETYSQVMILHALNIAVDALALARPDAFTETQKVTLVAGTDQKLPDGTIAIVGDISTQCTDKNGLPVTPISTAVTANVNRAYQFYQSRRCSADSEQYQPGSPCSKWVMSGYTYDARNPTLLKVMPPVPAGVSPVINVTAQKSPPCFDMASSDEMLFDRYQAPLLEFVLYLLYGAQQESESSLRAALEHRNTFFTLLKVKYTQDSRFASGYYLGQMGNPKADPNVIRGA